MTYGTTPFLAVLTLQQLASDERVHFIQTSKVLKEDFFVDDLLSCSDSIEEAKQIVSDLTALLEKRGLNLKKRASNRPEVLSNISGQPLAH